MATIANLVNHTIVQRAAEHIARQSPAGRQADRPTDPRALYDAWLARPAKPFTADGTHTVCVPDDRRGRGDDWIAILYRVRRGPDGRRWQDQPIAQGSGATADAAREALEALEAVVLRHEGWLLRGEG